MLWPIMWSFLRFLASFDGILCALSFWRRFSYRKDLLKLLIIRCSVWLIFNCRFVIIDKIVIIERWEEPSFDLINWNVTDRCLLSHLISISAGDLLICKSKMSHNNVLWSIDRSIEGNKKRRTTSAWYNICDKRCHYVIKSDHVV